MLHDSCLCEPVATFRGIMFLLGETSLQPTGGRFHGDLLHASSRGEVEVLRLREERFNSDRLHLKGQLLQRPSYTVANCRYGVKSGRP